MCIDDGRERPISFNQAAHFLSEGARPSCATWWRWWRKGVRGVRLATLVIGGRRFTTQKAVEEFIAATTAAASGVQPKARSRARRERDIARAEQELQAKHKTRNDTK